MIEFRIGTTHYTTTPENEQRVRESAEKAQKSKYRMKRGPLRKYPIFHPQMTTLQYVTRYEALNPHMLPIEWDCPNMRNPAAMLDPTQPEVQQLQDSED